MGGSLMIVIKLARKVVGLFYAFVRRIYWYCAGLCGNYRPVWINGYDKNPVNKVPEESIGRKFFVMMHRVN
jgi:hypothetical protein